MTQLDILYTECNEKRRREMTTKEVRAILIILPTFFVRLKLHT